MGISVSEKDYLGSSHKEPKTEDVQDSTALSS